MPRSWRRIALILGGVLAIILRILFTYFATFLLDINYLQTVGGLLLLWVTWRLVVEPEQTEQSKISAIQHQQEKTGDTFFTRITRIFSKSRQFIASARQPGQNRFLMAILAILITDVSTSLDNIIAIAALAQGQLIVLSIGLALSIIVLLIGSALVALLLERFPNLIILSGFVLAWISGNLILQDTSRWLPFVGQDMLRSSIIIYTLMFFFVLLAIRERRKRARRSSSTSAVDVDAKNLQTTAVVREVDLPLLKKNARKRAS
jgi:YjbE family integral membrane protein